MLVWCCFVVLLMCCGVAVLFAGLSCSVCVLSCRVVVVLLCCCVCVVAWLCWWFVVLWFNGFASLLVC